MGAQQPVELRPALLGKEEAAPELDPRVVPESSQPASSTS